MKRHLSLALSFLMFTSCTSLPMRSQSDRKPAAGPDGIQFNPVPLDARQTCDAVILEGTQDYKGTAFVLPRMLISINKDGDPLFEVIPKGDGVGYIFRFAVFFPRTDDQAHINGLRGKNSNVFSNGCNFDMVQQTMNQGAKPEDQIKNVWRVCADPPG